MEENYQEMIEIQENKNLDQAVPQEIVIEAKDEIIEKGKFIELLLITRIQKYYIAALLQYIGIVIIFESWTNYLQVSLFDYFIIGLLIVLTLGLTFGRTYRNFVLYQEYIFHIQTISFGICLGVINQQYQRESKQYQQINKFIFYSFIFLMINALLNLCLTMIKFQHYYEKLRKLLIQLYFPFNFLIVCKSEYFNCSLIFMLEGFIFYSLYYFSQLNYSLMNQYQLPQNNNPFKKFKQFQQLRELITIDNTQQYLMINIKLLTIYLSVLLVLALMVVVFATLLPELFVYVLYSIVYLITNIYLETQVVTKSLKIEDNIIAVSLTFLDFMCPLKNILKDLQI